MTPATAPGTRADGPKSSSASAALVETTMCTDRAAPSEGNERDAVDLARDLSIPGGCAPQRRQEVVDLRPAHQGADPRRLRRCRRRDTGRGPVQPKSLEGRLSGDGPDAGLGARVANGGRRATLEAEVGIIAELR